MSRVFLVFLTILVLFFLGCSDLSKYIEKEKNEEENIISEGENSKKIDINGEIKDEKVNILKIKKLIFENDKDNDGVLDAEDIVLGAREDAKNKPTYKSAYYRGGYPPNNEGVCTDVIWRAYKHAGYNIKDLIDKDIKENLESYSFINKPDPNIDFRRVRNLYIFFEKYGMKLTCELISNDENNLSLWQGGDIVIYSDPEHIGIVSDKRRADGIPLLIHNAGPYTMESDEIITWNDKIIGHYRFPYK